tara:strand:- start:2280 stop:2477 length:198 start_codon:yes stop_codon:yes gene_type:complete
MKEIEAGEVTFRTVYIDRNGETAVDLQNYWVINREHLKEAIVYLHDLLKDYNGAKDMKTTWRYAK